FLTMLPLAPNCECTVTPGLALVKACISAANGVLSVPAPNTVSVPRAAAPPAEPTGADEAGELPGELLQPAATAITTPAAAATVPRRSLRLISVTRLLCDCEVGQIGPEPNSASRISDRYAIQAAARAVASASMATYLRVSDDLAGRVASGELAAGDELPSVREAARRYGTTTTTAARAYRRLADAG